MSLYVVVEGHGERQALPALVGRLRSLLGLAALPYIPRDGGVSRAQLHLDRQRGQDEVAALCLQWRSRAPSAVLVTQDSDDACPKDAAPTVAGWIRQHNLRFPVAVVLFYREYETMFLAASASLAGARLVGSVPRAGLPPGAVYHGDPEARRDAKGWVSEQLGRPYLPNLDQESFTRTLDLDDQGLASLSSYRRLRSALVFLDDHAGTGTPGMAYP